MTGMTLYLMFGGAVLLVALALIALFSWAYYKFYVSIRPDEYVIHYGRGGRVKHCGRGISFFCWPGETYIAVPSTLRDVNFCADQITKEKQGVRVQGFMAYRIDDFEKAYQTLDLRSRSAKILLSAEKNVDNNEYSSKNRETTYKLDPDDALAKTDLVLRRLAESVVRHEVSNKTVEEMISEREAVIESMKDQIAPTVARWGLVVETIEFTEVWIRSKSLFENLQAEYRNEMRLKAEQSTAATEQDIAESRLESEREIARISAETQRCQRVTTSKEQLTAREVEIKNNELVRQKELAMEQTLREKELENRKRTELLEQEKLFEQQKREEELRQQQILVEREHELARLQEEHKLHVDEQQKKEELNKRDAETQRQLMEMAEQTKLQQAELERQRAEIALKKALEAEKQALEVKKLQSEQEAANIVELAEANRERALREAEARRKLGEVEAANEQQKVEARNVINNQQLQALFIQQLSAMASNMKVDEVNWFNMGGEGKSPLGIIPENILQLLGIFKGMGINVEGLLPAGSQDRNGKNGSLAKEEQTTVSAKEVGKK